MDNDVKDSLNKIGRGWFVLNLSNELLKTNYDLSKGLTDNSIKTRNNNYKKIKFKFLEILTDIKNNADNRLGVEQLGLKSSDILKIVDDLLLFIKSDKIDLAVGKTIRFGHDEDGEYVRYASNVLDNEKVPGLVQFLENEYEKIISFGSRFSTDLRKMPVILSKETPIKTYPSSDESKARRIKRLVAKRRFSSNISENGILKIIKDEGKKTQIFGKYFSDCLNGRPCIYIYYKNISCTNLKEYYSTISEVLAYEYMHFIHYINSPLFNKNDEVATLVKESLADFFAILFLVYSSNSSNLNLTVAKKRYDEWDDEFGSNWPYAEALWFYLIGSRINDFIVPFECYETYGLIDKFTNVLRASATSMQNAYDELQKNIIVK